MNILFLGLQYDINSEVNYIKNSKIGLQGAVNTFQWNLVDGLTNVNGNIDLYHTIPVGTYPNHYKKLFIKNKNWQYTKDVNCKEIGFVNLPIIKQLGRENNFKRKVNEWIDEKNGEKVIIAYSLYLPYLKVFDYIKKKYPDVKLCMIVADLPGRYGILPKNKWKSYFRKKYGNKIFSLIHNIDEFVLLTEKMKGPLQIKNKPYVVVEGICNEKKCVNLSKINSNHKVVLYTGTLQYQFGINNLLDAFQMINKKDYELWICGAGEAENEIKSIVKKDERVKFYGYVTKEEIHKMQQKATVLINPRTNDGEYTKYSFPSKTMEYMASGIPVLMYKLDGVPDEYDQYITYVKGNTVLDLKNSIETICEKSDQELYMIGENARDFMLKEKSSIMQSKKILEMIL